MNIAVQNDRQWLLLFGVLGLDNLASDDRLVKNSGRLVHRDEVEDAVANAVSTWTSVELEVALDQAGVPWGHLNQTAHVARHPQLDAGRRWRPVRLPSGETVSVVASPFRFAGWELQDTPRVPALGEHTNEALTELSLRMEARDG